MKVHVESVIEYNTSCNFCDKGQLMANRVGLSYPYDIVYVFGRSNGNGLKAAICAECLQELHKKVGVISYT